MLYVGVDVHWKKSNVCMLDEHGRKIKQQEIRGGWNRMVEYVGGIQEPFAVCFEASCGYGHLYERLAAHPQAQKVVVGHPGQMRLIYKSKKKHDRIDAKKIATLLYLDAVPAVYVPGADIRSWRAMIEWRQKLIAKRVASKNQIRMLLKNAGMEAPARLWTKKNLQWLKEQRFATHFEEVRRDMLVDEVIEQAHRIKQVEKALNQEAKKHPGVALLQTIPGVGPRTAEAVVAYIAHPLRFGRVRQVGSYFGMVPCQDASAERNRLGHITREGPPTVRKLLTEATWQGIHRCAAIREHYQRIVGDDPDRRKIALIATARWLVTVMLAMLKSGEVCRWPRDVKKQEEKSTGPVAAGAVIL